MFTSWYYCINQLVNTGGERCLKITYASTKVEKFFLDYNKMKREIPTEWVRTIKKHVDRLEAADTFGDFLALGLGKPEQLTGYKQIRYALHVTPNVRLILEPNATMDTVMICEEIEVEGVCDYHGDKENWYIP